jgi:SAM-dependent methyltransferase
MRASTPEHWEHYWRAHRDVAETYGNEDRLLREVRDLDVRGAWVLEVGAGSGRDSLSIAAGGGQVVVVDFVLEAFGVIRDQARAAGVSVHAVCCDALAMPFRDGTFALVFHQGLLEHFRDPLPLLVENRRVTARGGHCLVDVPQRYHLYTVMKHVLIAFNAWFAGWETEYSPGQLARLMRAAGFDVVRIGGDWLVPGLFYRALRYALRQARIARLPLYPRGIPPFVSLARRSRRWLRSRRVGPYTYAMVNALGRKPEAGATERV